MVSFLRRVFVVLFAALVMASVACDSPIAPSSVDSDSDGVYDDKDKCANTPLGTKVDLIGCPAVIADVRPPPPPGFEYLEPTFRSDGSRNPDATGRIVMKDVNGNDSGTVEVLLLNPPAGSRVSSGSFSADPDPCGNNTGATRCFSYKLEICRPIGGHREFFDIYLSRNVDYPDDEVKVSMGRGGPVNSDMCGVTDFTRDGRVMIFPAGDWPFLKFRGGREIFFDPNNGNATYGPEIRHLFYVGYRGR